ncbi:hypothetical protein L0F63_003502 [Massospora cicadina]|nr:hypothetical protein L0F63_003502 [Massospora cicadina]
MSCRMYENKFPEIDEVVMVNVRSIAEVGAYVQLLEYDNIEGMVLLSELSRRRIRSVQKIIRVGRNEAVVVMRVDKEKGYIDLSKRRVSPEEIIKAEEKYNKSKAVHGILRHVAEKRGLSLETLYEQFGWPLYRKYGHAYDAFRLAITEPDSVLEGLKIDPEVKEELLNKIRAKLTPQPTKLRADIEATCFGYDGIDTIKAALLAGEACSNKNNQIQIRLVAPPLYVMTTNSVDKNEGLEILEKAIATIQEHLQNNSGALTIKMKPKAVSDSDEQELADLMARVEKENTEIAGDDDVSEEE